MTGRIVIEIPGPAAAKGRARSTRLGRHYTPAATVAAEGRVSYFATVAMGGRPPLTDAVRVEIRIDVPVPQSWSKKRRAEALAGLRLPVTKPDIDNATKLLFDAFNHVVFVDDRQVVRVVAEKAYALVARTTVVVEPIDVRPI